MAMLVKLSNDLFGELKPDAERSELIPGCSGVPLRGSQVVPFGCTRRTISRGCCIVPGEMSLDSHRFSVQNLHLVGVKTCENPGLGPSLDAENSICFKNRSGTTIYAWHHRLYTHHEMPITYPLYIYIYIYRIIIIPIF